MTTTIHNPEIVHLPGKHELALALDDTEQKQLVHLLETRVRPSLTPDVSNYARGRVRCWLNLEAPLSNRQDWRPGLQVPDLWRHLKTIWQRAGMGGEAPDTALAIYGEIGIRPHRDATYAANLALTVNLGRVRWGWTPDRGSNDDRDMVWQTLTGGEVLKFDCKHRHAAHPAPDRWAIVCWRSKIALPSQHLL